MSESTKEALEEAYALRDKFSEYGGSLYGDELEKLITEVRARATNDALERVAKHLDLIAKEFAAEDTSSTYNFLCAQVNVIRALKVPQ